MRSQALAVGQDISSPFLEVQGSSRDKDDTEPEEILLFTSSSAASEIAYMLRGDWDNCNGVTIQNSDDAALETACQLLSTEFCFIWSCCALSDQDFNL